MDEFPSQDIWSQFRTRAVNQLNNIRGKGVRRLAENLLSLSVLQAVGYIIPLITLPYLVRVLGVEKFGTVAFAQAIIQYFIIFSDYGFNLSATREIAANRDDPEAVARIFCSVMTVRLLLMVVGFVILCGLVLAVPRLAAEGLIYLFAYGLVVGNVLFPVWFFQGMERMKHSTILTLMARGLFVVLIFVFVREQDDYIFVPLLSSLGLITAGLISLWMVRKTFRVGFRRPRWGDLTGQMKRSSQFFISRISVSTYTSLNTVVIGLATNDLAVGYYAAAEKLFIALRAAYYPLVQALYPYMTKRRQVGLFRKVFYLAVAAGVVTAVAGYLLAEPVTRLVFGDGFEPSAQIFQLFAIIIPVVVASIMLGYPFLAALGHERYANFSVAVGSVVHILMIVSLIPVISPTRVVLATMVTELLILGIRVYGVRKHQLWRPA